jgi:hypothetical protein
MWHDPRMDPTVHAIIAKHYERINYSATILLNNAATAVKHLMDPTWVMQKNNPR